MVRGSEVKPVTHYLSRAAELGLAGAALWAQQRVLKTIRSSSRALWSHRMAKREMTDIELLARTTGRWPTVGALLDHLASRPGSSFLLPHDSSQAIVSHLREHHPQYVSEVLAAAAAACQNEFNLLGHPVRYSKEVDWHKDPLGDWRWPLSHREELDDYLWSSGPPADLILLWELNRQQHFSLQGMAYWLTGNSRYVAAFAHQLQGWIEANPQLFGIHWYYSLEVALRLVAWTVAFQFCRQAPLLRERAGTAFLKSLWQQADFVSKHLQVTRTSVPNNHLLGEATGLALVGAAFPEFSDASAWRDRGLQLLTEQVPLQTHPDGVNKEQATGYHRFVVELLLAVVALGRRGLLPRLPILEDALARMLEYVLYSLTPAGTVPLWGDTDYGRAFGLRPTEDFWDWRPLLAAGAALFNRPDYKFVAGQFDEEALWLLGASGLAVWQQLEARPPKQAGRAFPNAGQYVIRDSWRPDSDAAFFRCGPFGLGTEGPCSHAHCDLLSMQLWVAGRPLLVDSGTYTYHGPCRDQFRLTAAHNTVMVDGAEQAEPRRFFGWRSFPQAQCLAWDGRRVVGAMPAAPGVTLQRELKHPQSGVWEIVDLLQGAGAHAVSWFFHFAPGLALHRTEGTRVVTVEAQGQPYVLVIPPAEVQIDIQRGWYSPRYGYREPAPLLVATWRGNVTGGGPIFSWGFQLILVAKEKTL
jgi:hypothetical protein